MSVYFASCIASYTWYALYKFSSDVQWITFPESNNGNQLKESFKVKPYKRVLISQNSLSGRMNIGSYKNNIVLILRFNVNHTIEEFL